MKISIDKLFQNKIKESKIPIPSEVWTAVETELKRRRMLRFLYWFVGVGFVSLMSFMFLFSQTEKLSAKDIHKNTTSKESSKNKIETSIDNKDAFSEKYKENQIKSQTKKDAGRNLSINIIKGKATGINKTTDVENISLAAKKGETTSFTSESKNNQHIKNKKIVSGLAKKQPVKKEKSDGSKNDSLNSLTLKKIDSSKVLKKSAVIKEEKPVVTEKNRKWSITPVFGAFNSRRYSEISLALDNSFDDNSSVGLPSISYGYKLAYEVSDKLSLQLGIVSKEVRFLTKDLFLTDIIGFNSSNIVYNPDILVRFSTSNINLSGEPDAQSVSLVQTIGYTEFPFEIRYAVYNKPKLKANFIIGLSFLYLNKNEIRSKTGLFTERIASVSNLLDSSLSYNLGLDIDYDLSKRFVFNAAIMLKKHFNTYSNYNNKTGPFVRGIHAGVGYRF